MLDTIGRWYYWLRDAVSDPSRAPDDVALARLRLLYVKLGRRYVYLHSGAAMLLPLLRLRRFQRRLRRDARRVTARELELLLDAGWRERMTACWLIAAGCRTELRERLAADLTTPSEGSLDDHPRALACFGTALDAEILAAFLGSALTSGSDTDGQTAALVALLHLDQVLGTGHAQRFLGPGGPWERRPGSTEVDVNVNLDLDLDLDLAERRHLLVQELALARGGRPDLRARLIRAGEFPKGWCGRRQPPLR